MIGNLKGLGWRVFRVGVGAVKVCEFAVRRPSRMFLPLTAGLLLLIAAPWFAVADEPMSKLRRYADGPLAASEFLATPPKYDANDPVGKFLAYTFVAVRWSFRYEIQRVTPDTEIQLTELNLFGVFEPKQSWLRDKQNQLILEHEQGHFDINEIFVLEAQLEIDQLLRRKRAPVVTGKTQAEAVAKMQDAIEKLVARNRQSLKDRHVLYDRDTAHGTARGPQMMARRDQLARLEALTAELKRTRAAATKRE